MGKCDETFVTPYNENTNHLLRNFKRYKLKIYYGTYRMKNSLLLISRFGF